ncbi:Prefoldin subunit alpha [uncultured archaeon]|nr:Prefoldin subunit alpha [uncultured archaeon]
MENQQEIIFKLSMFEQQMQQLQKQVEAVEQGILELNTLNLGLDDLNGMTGKEIFAPIGRGIFVKAKLLSEELKVDIGEGNFVTKNVSETKKILEKQTGRLEEIKVELNSALENLGEEITKTIQAAERMEQGHECSCGNHGDCECEEGKCQCDD